MNEEKQVLLSISANESMKMKIYKYLNEIFISNTILLEEIEQPCLFMEYHNAKQYDFTIAGSYYVKVSFSIGCKMNKQDKDQLYLIVSNMITNLENQNIFPKLDQGEAPLQIVLMEPPTIVDDKDFITHKANFNFIYYHKEFKGDI